MNLCWVDLETSGLDPAHGADIIEICVSITDRAGGLIKGFGGKILPRNPVSAEAASVNGYTREKWEAAGAESAFETFCRMREFFRNDDKMIPAGWNIPFDMGFLQFHCPTILKLVYHPFDLMAFGWNRICHIDRPHLSDLCKALGVPVIGEHTASGDVRMMIECYRKLRAGECHALGVREPGP